jgi:hypothetical protein
MAVGEVVSVVAGQFEVSGAKPPVGEVVSYDAVAGIAVIDMF